MGYLPSETRREYVHVGSQLWLLLRSTESIPGLDYKLPVCEGLRGLVPHITAGGVGALTMNGNRGQRS